MSDDIRPANNNVPDPERTIGRVLVMTAVVRSHLTGALDKYLAAYGATPEFRRSLQAYLAPTLTLVDDTERDVLEFVRAAKPSLMVGESFDTLLDALNRLADGPSPARDVKELVADARTAWGMENQVPGVRPIHPQGGTDGEHAAPANENHKRRRR